LCQTSTEMSRARPHGEYDVAAARIIINRIIGKGSTMCKKLIYLVSFVSVLGVVLTSTASAELIACWKFDDGGGTTAADASGNGHDGTLNGDATWALGQLGGALQLDGSGDYVNCGLVDLDTAVTGGLTVCAWINKSAGGDMKFCSNRQASNAAGGGFTCTIYNDRMELDLTNASARNLNRDTDGPTVPANTWVHVAWVYDDVANTFNEYHDAVLADSSPENVSIGVSTQEFRIGADAPGLGRYVNGLIDDLRIYDSALTEQEINAAMLGGGTEYPFASNPSPADGSLYTDIWATLTWRAGDFAVSHDVYLGDNFDDVNDGTPDSSAFQGNQTEEMLIVGFFGFPYPDGLVPGTTYYWRIDEVNDANVDSPWKGDVWSFWIPSRKAYEPDPADGARFIDLEVTLSWTAGFGAKLHYVHFGDNFDDVNSATEGALVTDASYTPGTLEAEKTYYWRVDESDGFTTYTGDVWSFKTLPDIPISDPNFIAWWRLDEGSGNTALDWSGHGNHATIGGTSDFVPGYDGDALDFDGSTDYIDVDSQIASGTFTLTMWIRPRDIPYSSGMRSVVHNDAWNAGSVHAHLRNSGWDSAIGASPLDIDINNGPRVGSTTDLQENEWYNCALTVTDVGGNASQLYINGILENSGSGGDGTPYLGPMGIGAYQNGASRHYHGLMDDIRIYDKVLTLDEIEQAMRGDTSVAWGPSPSNGSTTDIFAATTLTWSPGDNAAQHDVYFGTDRATVDAADASDTTGVYRGRQGLTSYTPPEGVELGGGPYYWRIDEFNTDGTIGTGRLWSFTVGNYGLVEDFESYNDIPAEQPGSNLVYLTWIDGYDDPATNGSTMGYPTGASMETDIVHGGRQSVPLLYSNVAVSISEVERTFAVPQNWTSHGLTTLSLWFHGDVTNLGGQLYVKVNGVEVPYDGDAANLMRPIWQVWNIDLTSLSANPQSVSSLLIGIRGPGTTGTLIFDDIRLLLSAPEPPEEIWLEAESAASVTPPMKIYNDPLASAGRYIGTDDGIGSENDNPPADGIATYSFTVDGGVYKIVFRAQPDAGNSFWVRIPGATAYDPGTHGSGWIRFNDIEAGAEWHWDEVHSSDHGNAVVKITLPAGQHTLEIARREDGGLLDAILITDDVE
jgi:hypothetical protein